ncbi:MAG: hypothetical protein AAF740_14350, partial [Bacteroidota bacterium]
KAEVEKIAKKAEEEREKHLKNYEEGKTTDENRPWIDMSTPFWAVWFSYTNHFKTPSPAMVYSIGQSEQYGFYKRITFWASPYDADLAEEIANPERLQTGTLDFAFVLLFLTPLLLLILLYNLKSTETEQGFMPLIEVQSASREAWLVSRLVFYAVLVGFVMAALLLYGAMLTDVFATAGSAFTEMLLHGFAYLAFWSVLYFFIVRSGKSIIGNTLKMTGVYLLFAFIIPATVHQYVSIAQPANLMTDFIDVRDQQEELYAQPDSVFQAELNVLFPEIDTSPVYADSTKRDLARNQSASALVNELKKASIAPIEAENQAKNDLIESTFWFNPISFFQNRFNRIAQTHFNDYQNYRNEIQALIDRQIRMMVLDNWQGIEVDGEKYLEYVEELRQVE